MVLIIKNAYYFKINQALLAYTLNFHIMIIFKFLKQQADFLHTQ